MFNSGCSRAELLTCQLTVWTLIFSTHQHLCFIENKFTRIILFSLCETVAPASREENGYFSPLIFGIRICQENFPLFVQPYWWITCNWLKLLIFNLDNSVGILSSKPYHIISECSQVKSCKSIYASECTQLNAFKIMQLHKWMHANECIQVDACKWMHALQVHASKGCMQVNDYI